MGILSIFRKPTPEEIYQEIASKIVIASLMYRTSLDKVNAKLSAEAGAEFAYLLLHLTDRAAFQIFGHPRREKVFNEISKRVIDDYSRSIFRSTVPEDIVPNLKASMIINMNDRQDIYGQCTSLTDDVFPRRGTMIFALAYFIHLALQRTSRTDVDDILCGRKDLTEADLDDFPDIENTLMLSVRFGTAAKKMRINDTLKKLQ